jgi:hypothetical protein
VREESFSVLWPLGPTDAQTLLPRSRLADLNGKRIGFVWDYVFRGDEMFPIIEAELQRRYPDAVFVPYERFGNIHGKDGNAFIDALPERYRSEGVDAVVVGVGNCGSCTPAVIRGAIAAERAGLPAVSIVSSGFIGQAVAVAVALGLESAPIAEYPGIIPFDSADEFAEKVREAVVPAVLDGFARPVAVAGAAVAEVDPAVPVLSGSYDEVVAHFEQQGWTDGLPIAPPTPAAVEAFLAWTDRDRDEVLGVLPPTFRAATVRSVAVNGVMAGCRPEHMPLLVAAVEAIADREFNLQHAGATPGWEPMVIVSGPDTKRLGFYSGTGALRLGHRANSALGRFMRLYMRNVAGLIPGVTDKGTLGAGLLVAVSEDEDQLRRIGWAPSRVDRGFASEDTVVTVQSVVVGSAPVYSGGTTPEQLLGPIKYFMAASIGPWVYTSYWYGKSDQLIVMSPAVAREFARHGWTKDDIRRRLFEELTVKASWIECYPLHAAGQVVPLERLVEQGAVDASAIASDDPDRLLPLLLRPESTSIVVAGDPDRNQSRIFWNNHEHGPATSRRVTAPATWPPARNRVAAAASQ